MKVEHPTEKHMLPKRLPPYKLSPDKPDAGDELCLVIWAPGQFGSLPRKLIASHIGLIAGGKFVDFQSYDDKVGDYSDNFKQPWYFLTGVRCKVSAAQKAKMKKLATNWGAWMAEGYAHQGWPLNCRACVAYVLFEILGVDPAGDWPGLGSEYSDQKQMLRLTSFVEEEILAPRTKKRKKREEDDESR
jgi:hypothetical protein